VTRNAVSLDAAAAACVLLTVYCAWRGERPGVFGLMVWCFALGSAFANWRHSSAPGAAPDAVWFFPAMSVAGPALLEAVLGRLRRWAQRDHGRRAKLTPTYGWRRWTPGIGSLRDTYGAYRTALLCGVETVEDSITAYHALCPDGSLRVAAALRHRNSHASPISARRSRPPVQPTGDGGAPADSSHEELLRRIPARPEAYRRWLAVWDEIRRDWDADPQAIADRHHVSVRQVQFIRRAGKARLLESTSPPALRTASVHRDDGEPGD